MGCGSGYADRVVDYREVARGTGGVGGGAPRYGFSGACGIRGSVDGCASVAGRGDGESLLSAVPGAGAACAGGGVDMPDVSLVSKSARWRLASPAGAVDWMQ